VALLLKRRGIARARPLAGGLGAWRDPGYPTRELAPAATGDGRVGSPLRAARPGRAG
jgi:hypothetical protein